MMQNKNILFLNQTDKKNYIKNTKITRLFFFFLNETAYICMLTVKTVTVCVNVCVVIELAVRMELVPVISAGRLLSHSSVLGGWALLG